MKGVTRVGIASLLGGITSAALACGAFSGDESGAGTTGQPEASLGEGSANEAGATDAGAANGAIQLAMSEPHVLDLVVDKDNVFWTTDTTPLAATGVLYACPKSGCADQKPVKVVGAPSAGMGTLASNGAEAYVTFLFSSGEVAQVTGTSLAVLGPVKLAGVAAAQVRPEALYLDEFFEQVQNADNTRHVYAWDGSTLASVAPIFIGAPEGGAILNTQQMAVTKDHVYLGVIDYPGIQGHTLGGSESWSSFFSDSYTYVSSMAATDDLVLWTDSMGTVRACTQGDTCTVAKTLMAPSTLGAGGGAVSVVARAGLVLAETSSGELYACTLPSCSDAHFVAHVGVGAVATHIFGHTMFADDTAIYFAVDEGPDAGDGMARIMKVMR